MMVQQNLKKSNLKEKLILAFVLVSSLLVMTEVGKNLGDEICITSEPKAVFMEPEQQTQSKINPTLSDV